MGDNIGELHRVMKGDARGLGYRPSWPKCQPHISHTQARRRELLDPKPLSLGLLVVGGRKSRLYGCLEVQATYDLKLLVLIIMQL